MTRLARLILGLCWCMPVLAQEVPNDDGLAPDLEARVREVCERGRATFEEEGELHRASVVRHGAVDPLLDWLEERADDEDADEGFRANARWLTSRLYYKLGRTDVALDLAKDLAQESESSALLLYLADLHDANGQVDEALTAYERVLELTDDEALRDRVKLHLALVRTDEGKVGGGEASRAMAALGAITISGGSGGTFTFEEVAEPAREPGKKKDRKPSELLRYAQAEGRADEVRNRSAIVLGLLARPEEAIELFVVEGEGSERFKQEIRLAEWSLRAEEWDKAQEWAWRALETATLTRDRRFALTVLVESYRKDDAVQELIDLFAAQPELTDLARNVWIDLLRETGEIDEALRLFREEADGSFTVEMRRELLEMCRESGREETLVAAYRDLIAAEQNTTEWREGLCRHYLERGMNAEARAVWASLLERDLPADELLWAAESLMGLGLDDLAIDCAERAVEEPDGLYNALPFLFDLHLNRGRVEEAEATLERMDRLAEAEHASRTLLAESFERIGNQRRAVDVLEELREARGPEKRGEDMEMRLAWLYSEIGEEEVAMDRWQEIWRHVQSIPRRRYVEDRMMTVASRLGRLADIAVDLEEKLLAGTADARDSGLLVRLYTKVGDAVSAAEIIEEYMKQTGGNPVEALNEKARVYLACTDYFNYEKTIKLLIEADPEGKHDYLRQLAMSNLERGRPDEAREALAQLKDLEGGADGAEFEAGVLALSGMRDEAIEAYNRGLAARPGRIDVYLLLANVMRDIGETEQAIGMFQYLAKTAEKDDLFTIAIDGLLNMRAPQPVLKWARRITLERLAGRHDKMYLYQLISDLSEELRDPDMMLRSLESSLPIAGEQRPAILRELMDLATANNRQDRHLAYGRRLLGLGDMVPPQVYLDLGEVFLNAGEVTNAAKTFDLARDLPDYEGFQRSVAESFESAGYVQNALRVYERSLISQSTNVELMAKTAEVHEQLGRDELARELYVRGIELLLSRRPFSISKGKEEADDEDPFSFWMNNRNVDDYDQHYERLLRGYLVTANVDQESRALLEEHEAVLREDLARLENSPEGGADGLDQVPRIRDRAKFLRRTALALGEPERAERIDLSLLAAFPEDEELLEELVRGRLAWGRVAGARRLIDGSGRPAEQKAPLYFRVGSDLASEKSLGLVPVEDASRLFLPRLITGRSDEVARLMQRLDLSLGTKDDLEAIGLLHSASIFLGETELVLTLSRHWMVSLLEHKKDYSLAQDVDNILKRCRTILDEDQMTSLVQFFAGRVAAKPEAATMLGDKLVELQKQFEEPLLESETVVEMIEGASAREFYGAEMFFTLLPQEELGATLRSIWPKVSKTRRAQFLSSFVQGVDKPFEPGLVEFLTGAFKEALAEIDNEEMFGYYVDDLASTTHNLETALALAEILVEHDGTNETYQFVLAKCLHGLEREQEALEVALESYRGLLKKKRGDYRVDMPVREIADLFLPKFLQELVAACDEAIAAGEQVEDNRQRRLDLFRTAGDDALYLEALLEACEGSEDAKLWMRLRAHYRSMGYRLAAQEAMLKALELEPDNPSYQNQAVSGWQQLHQQERALALKLANDARAEEDRPDEPAPEEAEPGEEEEHKKIAQATSKVVKQAMEDGDLALARSTFRRMWRNFRSPGDHDMSMVFMVVNGQLVPYNSTGSGGFNWPEDEPEDGPPAKPLETRRFVGGLSEFEFEQDVKPHEPLTAYQVLAHHAFGEDEMEKQLRAKDSRGIDSSKMVLEGVALAMQERLGLDGTVAELLAKIDAGRAGKLEYALLLTVLEENPDAFNADAQALLDDMLATLHPRDGEQLRRLARIYVAVGDTEKAQQLYRWCATLATSDYWGGGEFPAINANSLIEEVKDGLEGSARTETIEQILKCADPGQGRYYGRDGFDHLVLDTWIEVLGEDDALDRCAPTLDTLFDTSGGIKRSAANRATDLVARSGDIERALRCLEYAVCEFPETELQASGPYRYWFEYSLERRALSRDDRKRMFPSDVEGWQDAPAWLVAAAGSLRQWMEEDRIDERWTLEVLCLIAVRMGDAGLADEGLELVRYVDERAGENTNHRLWVIDAARRLGDEELARATELELLDEGRLHPERVPELVEATFESRGVEEGLAFAERAAKYVQHPRLVDWMIEAAEARHDTETLIDWSDRKQAAAAAVEALKPPQPDEEQAVALR